jgi:ribose 5-phosphate isomerase B
MEYRKVYIASDHAGYELKERIIAYFSDRFDFENLGCFSTESVDYPDYAHALGCKVNKNPEQLSILLCGSGNGVAMTANKYPHVRAALCWNEEITCLARKHNDANVLVLPARFITDKEAFTMVEVFFNTAFEGGRHLRRVEKIIPNKCLIL